ncbi:heteromeric transposase endonuclease subunit TnsA [Caminibacter mediatlanticus]|uniref:TnsA endonuclease N-terminal domain-containing protein n=1 Tax=Caminibacter mediatlanticus TB-2 TaxID=391592 RepID=A0AAI9F2B0_9BACT|nr:heteromeric transposase endonuclease subunit TnsA [Caminibacter mediatlanticus]EDM23570.1 hypothetical protein CMTB2_04777 [Caminibacter mediatlanticus TB-2]
MPVRKIPIQSQSVSGRFFSHKNNKLLDFESQLEKKCYLILEFDNEIINYEPQPLKIKNYIPDILAYRKNNKPLLIEVKYSNEAFTPNEKLQKKFDTLKEYSEKNNFEFKIFTEKDINEPYFSNINLIYNYANINLPRNKEKEIIQQIPSNGITIANLLKVFNNDLQYLAYIYHLIFKQVLNTNLYQQINYNSIIRINND